MSWPSKFTEYYQDSRPTLLRSAFASPYAATARQFILTEERYWPLLDSLNALTVKEL